MVTLKVVIGDTVLSKSMDWDDLMAVKDKIKQFCRWSPSSSSWVLKDIRPEDIESAAILFAEIFDSSSNGLREKLKKHIEETIKKKDEKLRATLVEKLSRGEFAVATTRRLDREQWNLAMCVFRWDGKYLILDEQRLIRYLVENNISEGLFVSSMLSLMNSLNLRYYDEHVEYLRKEKERIYEMLRKQLELKDACILEDSGTDIIVRFGRRLDNVERDILYKELSTSYFVSDKHGNLTEHRMRVIKYDKEIGAFRLPYFAIDHLYRACKKIGIKKVVDNVKWVKKEIPKPEFRLKLYPFQHDAVAAWLDNNCKGVVCVPTGGGKTIIALAALQVLHKPTLICVPTIELARQWRDTIRRVLGINAGILGGGNKTIKPVTVAIYNSAVKEIKLLKEMFDLVIFDECFVYDTLVLTDRGWMKIGDIVENKLPVKVLTHTGKWRKVVGWIKKPVVKPIVKVVLENGIEVECTKDHKILTKNGWKKAGDLVKGDIVTTYRHESYDVSRVAGVYSANGANYVYDLTVEEDHTYIANGIVVHNCHHVPAETFRKVAFNIKARNRLGLSATPQRTDRNEALIFFSVGNMVYKANYGELVKLKLASPLKFKTIYVDLTKEEMDRYAEAENDEKARVQKTMKVALQASKKYPVLKKILEAHKGAKTLVFTQYLEQAEKAFEIAKGVLKDKVALITGNTPSKDREQAFKMFKEGEITCLVSTTVLDEGVDVPDAEVAVIMSGTSTERQLIQRIGRVIRYHPNKVAKIYEIVTRGTIEEDHAERRRYILKDYQI